MSTSDQRKQKTKPVSKSRQKTKSNTKPITKTKGVVKTAAKAKTSVTSPRRGNLQWQYKSVEFPKDKTIPEAYKGEKPPYAILGSSYTVAMALNEFWVSMERDVHEAIKDEVEQGWEPDPNGWGPSCIEYRTRKVGTDYWSGGQWVGYIIFGLVSYGLLLLVLPFTWKADILEPVRLKVRLRRLKR